MYMHMYIYKYLCMFMGVCMHIWKPEINSHSSGDIKFAFLLLFLFCLIVFGQGLSLGPGFTD